VPGKEILIRPAIRAIGHLFEAEDESQAWPDLHDAIREARKACQATGAMPDLRLLAGLVAHGRESAVPAGVTSSGRTHLGRRS